MTDPIWSERCSASQWVGPKRYCPPPVALEALPKIDAAVISHNHYDHLDTNTVRALKDKVRTWYVPLGVGPWMRSTGINNVVEMDWWDSVRHCKDAQEKDCVQIVCTPCQHFSGRTLWDRSETLWASWSIIGKDKRSYFAGDTGYRAVPRGQDTLEQEKKLWDTLPVCPAFCEIGEKYGPFDLACIPIGAYSPRWFMSRVHASPEDAVCIHRDIRSKKSVGMHWGTFILTDEPVLEPIARLQAALKDFKLRPDAFVVLKPGETMETD